MFYEPQLLQLKSLSQGIDLYNDFQIRILIIITFSKHQYNRSFYICLNKRTNVCLFFNKDLKEKQPMLNERGTHDNIFLKLMHCIYEATYIIKHDVVVVIAGLPAASSM